MRKICTIWNSLQNRVEPLEARRLLAAAVSGSVLRITGTSADDVISLAPADNNTVAVSFDGQSTAFAAGSFNKIDIRAGDGNDSVSIDAAILKPALILGEAGDDALTGGGGDDTLVGGLGSDALAGGGTSNAPGGVNVADFTDHTNALSINGQTAAAIDGSETDQLLGNLQTILSGAGDDQINLFYDSSPGATRLIDAGAGNDNVTFQAGGFDPTVQGGAGDDTILMYAAHHTASYFGDAGDDTFLVARSSATARIFNGGDGADTVDFSGFINEFWPVNVSLDGVANDGSPTEIAQQTGADNVGADIERIIGTPGADTIVGAAGNETILGNGGNDSIDGAGGNDSLDGGAGNDTLIGGSGSDSIVGGAGVDRITSDNTDSVIDAPEADLANGILDVSGSGDSDTISVELAGTNPQRVRIRINGALSEFAANEVQSIRIDGGAGDDSITVAPSIKFAQALYGGDGNDTIAAGSGTTEHGKGAHNILDGGAGNDSLLGGSGDDILLGSSGNDTLSGGGGVDSLDGGAGKNRLLNDKPVASSGTVTLSGGVLRITGTSDDDSIVIRPTRSDASRIDVVVNGATQRFTLADVSRFSIAAGDGDDHVEFNSAITTRATIYGEDGDDSLIGSSGADRFYGGDGNDWISAGAGNDIVYGEAGDDRVFGGSGRDYLSGGSGSNTLRGEEGRDQIIAGSDDNVRGNADDLVSHE